MEYEAVIGLEVHVQIKTESKIFSGSRSGYGYEPNTLVDPVVLGLPGSLPVMNKTALDGIIKAGLALNCTIPDYCKWDRKNYSRKVDCCQLGLCVSSTQCLRRKGY